MKNSGLRSSSEGISVGCLDGFDVGANVASAGFDVSSEHVYTNTFFLGKIPQFSMFQSIPSPSSAVATHASPEVLISLQSGKPFPLL